MERHVSDEPAERLGRQSRAIEGRFIAVRLESTGVASPKSALGSIQPLPGRNRQNTPLFTLLPPFHHVRVAGLDPFSPRRNRLFAASSTAGLAHIRSKASAEQTLLTLAGLAFSGVLRAVSPLPNF